MLNMAPAIAAPLSLSDLVNELARAPSSIGAPNEPVSELDEFEAFCQFDTLLSALNKDYLTAKAQRQLQEASFGKDDAMAEIAALAEDSAWCALQTRLLELRRDAALRRQVNEIIRRRKTIALQQKIQEQAKEKADMLRSFFLLMKQKKRAEKENKSNIFEYAVLLFMFKLVPVGVRNNPLYISERRMA
jgi:hypothetical protein